MTELWGLPAEVAVAVGVAGADSVGVALSVGVVVGVAVLGILLMFLVSWALSRTMLRGEVSTFSLELPPYRPPRVLQTLYTSIIDRTLIILWRAVIFAVPAGAVIWLVAMGEGVSHRAQQQIKELGAAVSLYKLDTGRFPKELDALLDGGDLPDFELALFHCVDHTLFQHQVLHVGRRNHHALIAGQSLAAADVKKPLDFLVPPADGLDFAGLVDRSGDGHSLVNGDAGQAG